MSVSKLLTGTVFVNIISLGHKQSPSHRITQATLHKFYIGHFEQEHIKHHS